MQAARIFNPMPMDRTEFSELIQSHHRVLYAYAIAISRSETVARDLVQDAFVAAWQSIGTFDVTRDFPSWLRGIVRNKWREHCRVYAREVAMDEKAFSRLEQTLAPYSEGDNALFSRLAECREKLPDPMQEAITLSYDEGRSSDEASAALSLSPAAFRKRLERAREAIRLCLSKSL
ncbi:MAG: polymerase sigma factor, sigma-70 family [Akkermansiaceae bacterium]|nr:polymerase sigma factor, sigma-70 family [Akkermansiaceae bacterium]